MQPLLLFRVAADMQPFGAARVDSDQKNDDYSAK
jgi:hypothetical protein